MKNIEFDGKTFFTEHDRNRYVYLNRKSIFAVDKAEILKKQRDPAAEFGEEAAGCWGMSMALIFGTTVCIVLVFLIFSLFPDANEWVGCILPVTLWIIAIVGVRRYYILKERKEHRQTLAKAYKPPPKEESLATKENIERYFEQYQKFLESTNTPAVREILDRFTARFPSAEFQKEHHWDVANLIKIKTGLGVTYEDIPVLLKKYVKTEEDLAAEQLEEVLEAIKSEMEKTGARTLPEVAAAFNKVFYKDYEDTLFSEDTIYPVFAAHLSEKGMPYTASEVEDEVDRQRFLEMAGDFESKLDAAGGDERELESILDGSDAQELEQLVARLFQKAGYTVEATPRTEDRGVDLIIEKDRVSAAVRVKKFKGRVGEKAVREAMETKKRHGCARAIVATTGEFTDSATFLAIENRVELMDRKGILDLMKSAS